MGKKWYKAYLANNDVVRVYKTFGDRLWQPDLKAFRLFHNEEGKQVLLSTHFLLKLVEE